MVDFGSLRPSEAIGIGFRVIGGHLQVIFLRGSSRSHKGQISLGAAWGFVQPVNVERRSFLKFINILNLFIYLIFPFEAFFSLFSFREAFRATRGISVLELFGGYVHPFLVIQKPRYTIFDLLSLMAEVSEPFEVIFTFKFSMQD